MSKAKLSRMSGKNLILSAIKALEEETGFHFIDVEFGNTYFLFEGAKDSICHFHIKEIPKFKFAFWNTNRFDKVENQIKDDVAMSWSERYNATFKSELLFFTQFERDIDKFKPSYSGFRQGIQRIAWYEISDETKKKVKKEEWHLADLPEILKFMKKHPIKAYVYAGCQRENIWEEISGLRAFKIYVKSSYWHYVYKFKNWVKVTRLLSKSKKMVRKLKTMDYMVFKRCDCYPEVEIRITDNKKADPIKYAKDVNIIEKFEDKYSNKVSLDTWFVYNETEEPLDKEYKKIDKDLHKRFYSYAEKIIKVANGKTEETLEDSWISKIVAVKLNREV